MMLGEANARLNTKICEEQLWQLNALYLLLDLDKDDFCKIVDTVGVDILVQKQSHYERLTRAEEDLTVKERYINAKARLEKIRDKERELQAIVDAYKPF